MSVASACSVEAFGRSILEAQASRTPVVAPDLLGVSDIVEDGSTGFVFEPESTHSLADALQRLFEADDVARIVDTAERRARRLDIAKQGQLLVAAYRQLVG